MTSAEADELSELASVDMAAARIAASISPTRPVFAGKTCTMKSAKTFVRLGDASIVRMLSVVASQLDADEQKHDELQEHDDAA